MPDFSKLIGADYPTAPLDLYQVAARAVLIYFFGLLIVRIGKSRLLSSATPLDVLMGFILGSLLSRAITGTASLVGTLVASIVLVSAHWLITAAAYKSHALGDVIKGHSRPIVQDGEVLWMNMRQSHISEHDLESAMRLNGVEHLAQVSLATKERNGEISVVAKRNPPMIFELPVEEGVKRIKIELD